MTEREQQVHTLLALAHNILHHEWLDEHKANGFSEYANHIRDASEFIIRALDMIPYQDEQIAI